ncbi:RNA-binding protein pno1 [Ceratitis capitata]|uniref:RNA-binding protein pno1 n=1 Tax=Ceratitis capitata TaxID=7213 RepID=UPI000329F906|nr:RNA-binding protein pno1 [Ceratitis capitata]
MEVENIKSDDFQPPTALKKATKRSAEQNTSMQIDEESLLQETKQRHQAPRAKRQKSDVRKISVPPHRYSSLKEHWMKIFTPVVEHMKLQIRFNMKAKQVELRLSAETPDISNLQKGADFVKAFLCGFEVDDALALLRLEDLFVETFEVKDVKTLRGDHLSRAIGRLAGKGGRTKFTIENVTKTRIVLADSKIHILGSYQNIQLARRAICNLILGSPPSKVYGNLRSVASRLSERM